MSGSAQSSRAARPAEPEVEARGVPTPAVVARGATEAQSRASAERVSRAVAEQLIEMSRRASAPAVIEPEADPAGQEGAGPGPDDPDRSGRFRRLHRLRVGWHTASPAALAGLTRPSAPDGVLLGRSTDGTQVRARFFRRTPVRMVLVGRHRLARLLLVRSAVAGARPVVLAGEPAAWNGFRNRLAATGTEMAVLGGDVPFRLGGSVTEPLFVVRSADETRPTPAAPRAVPGSPASRPAAEPWDSPARQEGSARRGGADARGETGPREASGARDGSAPRHRRAPLDVSAERDQPVARDGSSSTGGRVSSGRPGPAGGPVPANDWASPGHLAPGGDPAPADIPNSPGRSAIWASLAPRDGLAPRDSSVLRESSVSRDSLASRDNSVRRDSSAAQDDSAARYASTPPNSPTAPGVSSAPGNPTSYDRGRSRQNPGTWNQNPGTWNQGGREPVNEKQGNWNQVNPPQVNPNRGGQSQSGWDQSGWDQSVRDQGSRSQGDQSQNGQDNWNQHGRAPGRRSQEDHGQGGAGRGRRNQGDQIRTGLAEGDQIRSEDGLTQARFAPDSFAPDGLSQEDLTHDGFAPDDPAPDDFAQDDLAADSAGWPGGWWRCDVLLVPQVGPAVLAGLQRNDLVVTSRLETSDAERLCATRRVAGLTPDDLTTLGDDAVMVIADGRARVVRLGTSPGEETLLGFPMR